MFSFINNLRMKEHIYKAIESCQENHEFSRMALSIRKEIINTNFSSESFLAYVAPL